MEKHKNDWRSLKGLFSCSRFVADFSVTVPFIETTPFRCMKPIFSGKSFCSKSAVCEQAISMVTQLSQKDMQWIEAGENVTSHDCSYGYIWSGTLYYIHNVNYCVLRIHTWWGWEGYWPRATWVHRWQRCHGRMWGSRMNLHIHGRPGHWGHPLISRDYKLTNMA